METPKKKLVCNDCGCRFEVGAPEDKDIAKKPPEPATPVLCPECKSMNITTA